MNNENGKYGDKYLRDKFYGAVVGKDEKFIVKVYLFANYFMLFPTSYYPSSLVYILLMKLISF